MTEGGVTMLIVVAMVLTLLGVLAVIGFFILRGAIRDGMDRLEALIGLGAPDVGSAPPDGQQRPGDDQGARGELREALRELREAKASIILLGRQVFALNARIVELTGEVKAHLHETTVGPVSVRGGDVPATLAVAAGAAPPPHSGTVSTRR